MTQTKTFTVGKSDTTTIVITDSATTTSTVVIGASATVHITATSTVDKQSSSVYINPFTITGIVVAPVSTLQSLLPTSAQTDPAAACFIQPRYSACYSTPAWWSTIPGDSQSYFSSINSANTAACTACAAMGQNSNNLSIGAKAGIGIGAAIGAASVAALGKNPSVDCFLSDLPMS